MPRATANDVRAAVPVLEGASLDQYIETANALTSYIASKDSGSILTSTLLRKIETYLAAHYYALFDPQYASKATDGASGNFIVGQSGQGLNATHWGQQAIALDLTGTLADIAQGGATIDITWLGQPVNEQVDYWDKN
jgi:hypothetical protein